MRFLSKLSDINPATHPDEYIQSVWDSTQDYLMSDDVGEILFDLTNVSTASRTYIPGNTNGFFARQELKMILDTPDLFRKTRFYSEGSPAFPSTPLRARPSEVVQRRFLEGILDR
jgi:hypothetical protein